eukprot:2514620-Ditylum_brightwellii.AAC.1
MPRKATCNLFHHQYAHKRKHEHKNDKTDDNNRNGGEEMKKEDNGRIGGNADREKDDEKEKEIWGEEEAMKNEGFKVEEMKEKNREEGLGE